MRPCPKSQHLPSSPVCHAMSLRAACACCCWLLFCLRHACEALQGVTRVKSTRASQQWQQKAAWIREIFLVSTNSAMYSSWCDAAPLTSTPIIPLCLAPVTTQGKDWWPWRLVALWGYGHAYGSCAYLCRNGCNQQCNRTRPLWSFQLSLPPNLLTWRDGVRGLLRCHRFFNSASVGDLLCSIQRTSKVKSSPVQVGHRSTFRPSAWILHASERDYLKEPNSWVHGEEGTRHMRAH